MDNIIFYEIATNLGLIDYVQINNEDGSITTMEKSHWDKLQAAKETQSL